MAKQLQCAIFEKEAELGCHYEIDGVAFNSISDLIAHVNKGNKKLKLTYDEMRAKCEKCRRRMRYL